MTTATRALRLLRHGDAPVVEDVALPGPGPGEVLLELRHAGVNPVDRYLALGVVAPGGPLPRTLGVEAAGLLDGHPVVVCGAGLGVSRDGLWAGHALVPRESAVPVPAGVGLAEAAAVGIVGTTAHSCVVELAGVEEGDRVLVLGASGGVGLSVLSLSRSLGATVLAHTGSPGKDAALRELGAHEVVHGTAAELADVVGELRPTVVIDALGGDHTRAALGGLQPFGRHVLFGTTCGPRADLDLQAVYRNNVRLLGYSVQAQPDARRRTAVGAALSTLAAGRMRIPVARHVPLEEGAGVLDALLERDRVGKVVLDLG